MRRSHAVLLVVVVVALAGGVAWWALRSGGQELPEESSEIVAVEMDPFRKRALEHDSPYPFNDFLDDIAALRAPDGPADPLSEDQQRRDHELKLSKMTKVSIDVTAATVPEVVAALEAVLKEAGVPVFTYDRKDIADMVADQRITLHMTNVPFWSVIDEIRGQTNERVRYIVTSQGLFIGGEAGVQLAQMEANLANATVRAAADRKSALLDKEFRPDFADAWVRPITKMIADQTGVEVVVDAPTWQNKRTLTWRAKPMPLRDALDRICRELRCVYRVRGDRVFLIEP